MDADRRLATYLSDHLAGSSAAIRLAQRHVDREASSPSATVVAKLLVEIREDRETLERVMEAVGAAANPIKQAGAIGAEVLTSLRNKVPVLGAGSEEIMRLEELEILSLGIEGKRLLWLALETRSDAAFASFDFPALAKRAKTQRDRLEPLRRDAAVEAFGGA